MRATDQQESKLHSDALNLGGSLSSFGIDAVDLDMIKRGDMLGSALGERVFSALAALSALAAPGEQCGVDQGAAREMVAKIMQEPSSVERSRGICIEALVAARGRGEAKERESVVGRIATLRGDRQQLRLHLGEMSAQEMRTLQAGLQLAEAAIKSGR